MKVGELFADSETIHAAIAYAIETCEYSDEMQSARDAFIAGAVWNQFRNKEK